MTFQRRHWLALVGLLVLLLVVLFRSPPSDWAIAPELAAHLVSYGAAGFGVLLLAGGLATAIGVPRQLLALVGGYAYGWPTAVLLGTLGATLGCFLTFTLSRRVLSARVRARWPRQVEALDSLLQRDAALKILILRLQPLGTNMLTNITAGVTAIPARVFLLASMMGFIPQMLVFALLGDGIRMGSRAHLVFGLVLLGVSVLLGVFLYRRQRPCGAVRSLDR